MVSQSFSLIYREDEELIAFQTRQGRAPTLHSRPSSRMEEMLSRLLKSQKAATRSLESRLAENSRMQAENTRSLDNKMSDFPYKQVEQIAEMSDLVDRISTEERSIQASPVLGSNPTRRNSISPGSALIASVSMPSETFSQSTQPVLRRSLRLQLKNSLASQITDARFLN